MALTALGIWLAKYGCLRHGVWGRFTRLFVIGVVCAFVFTAVSFKSILKVHLGTGGRDETKYTLVHAEWAICLTKGHRQ